MTLLEIAFCYNLEICSMWHMLEYFYLTIGIYYFYANMEHLWKWLLSGFQTKSPEIQKYPENTLVIKIQ